MTAQADLDAIARLASYLPRTPDLDAITAPRITDPEDPLHGTAGLLATLTHWLPRARACADPGSGLRSPSLDPGGGGRGDPVGEQVVGRWPDTEETDSRSVAATGRTLRAGLIPAGGGQVALLDQAEAHIAAARRSMALAVQAEQRAKETI